VIIFLVIKTQN
jgi:hypothetical protein